MTLILDSVQILKITKKAVLLKPLKFLALLASKISAEHEILNFKQVSNFYGV